MSAQTLTANFYLSLFLVHLFVSSAIICHEVLTTKAEAESE